LRSQVAGISVDPAALKPEIGIPGFIGEKGGDMYFAVDAKLRGARVIVV
jgi:hypothetical protein